MTNTIPIKLVLGPWPLDMETELEQARRHLRGGRSVEFQLWAAFFNRLFFELNSSAVDAIIAELERDGEICERSDGHYRIRLRFDPREAWRPRLAPRWRPVDHRLVRRSVGPELDDSVLRALIINLRRVYFDPRFVLGEARVLWLVCPLDGQVDPTLICRDLIGLADAITEGEGHRFGPVVGAGRASLVLTRHVHTYAPTMSWPRRNEEIRAPLIRLLGPGKQELGFVDDEEARAIAGAFGLDLVERACGLPSICQLMDYGRWRYDKTRRARGRLREPRLKKINLRLRCGPVDLERKLALGRSFLEKGHSLELRVRAVGRDRYFLKHHPGYLDAIVGELERSGVLEAKRGNPARRSFRFRPTARPGAP